MKNEISEDVILAVGDMIGSDEIAVQLVPVFEENIMNFDENGYPEMSSKLKNYMFFVWVMGFACGLDNAEGVNEFLSIKKRPIGSLQ